MKGAAVLLVLAVSVVGAEGYINPRPPFVDKARFARWLVHESNWTILASKSYDYGGSPYPNLLASSDGTSFEDCTPNVYLYFTNMSTIVRDMNADNDFTLGFFEAGENDKFCLPGSRYDPEDPNCAKAHIVGKLKVICEQSACPEAQKYLFWRHPAMATWPAEHAWKTAVFEISHVDVLDFYGNISVVSNSAFMSADCK